MGFSNRDDRYGIVLKFADKVDVATSHFKIKPMTMFARIGGIIGVGQVFLWILNYCFKRVKLLNYLSS